MTIKGAMLTAVTVGLVLSNIQIIRDGGHIVPFASVAAFEFLGCIYQFNCNSRTKKTI